MPPTSHVALRIKLWRGSWACKKPLVKKRRRDPANRRVGHSQSEDESADTDFEDTESEDTDESADTESADTDIDESADTAHDQCFQGLAQQLLDACTGVSWIPPPKDADPPLYEVREAGEGRGMGMFARGRITKHQCILSEVPLLCASSLDSISDELKKLPHADQKSFWALHDWHSAKHNPLSHDEACNSSTSKTEQGIFQTNALPCGPESPVGAIFAYLCRINHSCVPNSAAYWDAGSGRKFLVAVCDIEQSHEICISYLSPFEDYGSRSRLLRDKFGFCCQCGLCSLPYMQRVKNDEDRREAGRMHAVIPQMAAGRASLSASMAIVASLIDLLQKIDVAPVSIARTACDAYQLCLGNGARGGALSWLQVYARYMELAEGPESEDARKAATLLQSPFDNEYAHAARMARLMSGLSGMRPASQMPLGIDSSQPCSIQ